MTAARLCRRPRPVDRLADAERPCTQPIATATEPVRRVERAVTDAAEDLLTISEVIAELRIPRATFYRWRQLGIGPASVKLPNGQVRISRAALRQWLRDHADTNGPAI
jgi:predicted DNA-binding transcriptional regulator AlpA